MYNYEQLFSVRLLFIIYLILFDVNNCTHPIHFSMMYVIILSCQSLDKFVNDIWAIFFLENHSFVEKF